jgi:hypothetical protein
MHRELPIWGSLVWVALASAAPRAQAASTCVTAGVLDGDEVTLVFAGAEPFAVRLRGQAKLRVTFSEGSAPQVEAAGPAATLEGPGHVVHHLGTATSLEQGLLFINETVPLPDLRFGNGVLQASVSLDKRLVARDVHLPCNRLRGGAPAKNSAQADRPEPVSIGMARARTKDLVVHEGPGTGAAVRLEIEPQLVTFDVVRRQDGWTKIWWSGDTGELQGWTPSRGLRIASPRFGRVEGGWTSCCAVAPVAKGARRVTAKLRAGATIHASPAGPRWGLVHIDVNQVEIEDVPGQEWLRVLNNATIGETACDPRRSWVRRSDLVL